MQRVLDPIVSGLPLLLASTAAGSPPQLLKGFAQHG
jgi:hypothetical protein